MSPIGRIFVVINLVLAGLFLGSAATNLASAQKYRSFFDQEVAAKKALEAELTANIESLRAEKIAAENIRNDIKNQKDALDAQKTALEQDIQEKTDELNVLKSNVGNIDSALADMAKQLEDQSSQVKQANDERVAAVEARRDAEEARDEAIQAKASAEDQSNDYEKQIAQLRTELNTTRNELRDANTLIDVAVATTGVTRDALGGAAPLIEGAVLQVATDVKPGLVHINRGSADDVKTGYVFDIYSSGVYKGRARVELVNSNSCTARIMNVVEGTTIMQGDSASTRI